MKSDLKKKATALRKKGKTYSEILKEVPVAKSTLSLWLREVGLAKPQQQRLTARKRAAQLRGGEARRRQRIRLTEKIQKQARKEIGGISKRELWLMGTMLYWAEGSKEKPHSPGVGIEFSNSDPRMIKLFLRWLTEICNVERVRIRFSLYIHENNRHRLEEVESFWEQQTGFPKKNITYVYFKKHNVKTKRKNIGDGYYGNLLVRVKASSELNRKVEGWVQGVVKNYCRVVQW